LLQFLAEEVRLLLAKMGYRSLSELIGRADLLATRTDIQLQKSEVRFRQHTASYDKNMNVLHLYCNAMHSTVNRVNKASTLRVPMHLKNCAPAAATAL
jgi:2,3-bisphosphoglycerate-independent phosphoglycerate mutase